MKYGRTLICENEGCEATFTTALGYLTHQKICGVKEEDREKFTCEICDKVYMSSVGLKYHMQAKHTQVNIIIHWQIKVTWIYMKKKIQVNLSPGLFPFWVHSWIFWGACILVCCGYENVTGNVKTPVGVSAVFLKSSSSPHKCTF